MKYAYIFIFYKAIPYKSPVKTNVFTDFENTLKKKAFIGF